MDILYDFKKCCFSGYRPSKMPFKFDDNDIDFQIFEKRLYTTVEALLQDDCRIFYCGMAMGFDILAAKVVLYFKKRYNDIKLICAIPFEEQEMSFPQEWKEKYYCILQNCDEVIVLSKQYHNGCYQNRNKYMVDNSDYVVTWYDGKAGGTRNTLKYAEKKNRYIININTNYLDEFNNKQMGFEF